MDALGTRRYANLVDYTIPNMQKNIANIEEQIKKQIKKQNELMKEHNKIMEEHNAITKECFESLVQTIKTAP